MVLLLPKLRRYFAEFLNHSSLDRLSILYLTTCVGLGYGPQQHSLEAFLDSMGSLYFASIGYASRLTLHGPRIYLGTRLHAYTRTTNAWRSYPPASPHRLPTTSSVSHAPPTPTSRRKQQSGLGWLASPASTRTHHHGHGNINPLSIDYA